MTNDMELVNVSEPHEQKLDRRFLVGTLGSLKTSS
jgi:hypothetical protein